MPIRSDEQRDKCIDALFARISALEHEVATLKGEPLYEEKLTTRNVSEFDTSQELSFSKIKENINQRKTIESSLENAIGTRWIGRIGVLAILFGVAFFLKYSLTIS